MTRNPWVAALLSVAACGGPPAPATRNDSLLAVARSAYERTPDNVDSIIWYGRRLAYVGRYDDALATYTGGLARHPDDPRLLRHRGHRWITARRFDSAVVDLSRADSLIRGTPDVVEPDGQPNAAGIPVSTLHSNIGYHLALAHYLRGAFDRALALWERGLAAAPNPDMDVAFRYWAVLTARRLGAPYEHLLVAIPAAHHLHENLTYQRLLRYFQGTLPVDSVLPPNATGTIDNVTAAYGVAMWGMLHGELEGARQQFGRILTARDQQAAFGYIAAEAELARIAAAH